MTEFRQEGKEFCPAAIRTKKTSRLTCRVASDGRYPDLAPHVSVTLVEASDHILGTFDAALVELKGKGVKLLDEEPRIGHGGSRIAFINPESTGNILIELAEMAEGH